jgi:hypothetical protein
MALSLKSENVFEMILIDDCSSKFLMASTVARFVKVTSDMEKGIVVLIMKNAGFNKTTCKKEIKSFQFVTYFNFPLWVLGMER